VIITERGFDIPQPTAPINDSNEWDVLAQKKKINLLDDEDDWGQQKKSQSKPLVENDWVSGGWGTETSKGPGNTGTKVEETKKKENFLDLLS
jgi:hypothetical protein